MSWSEIEYQQVNIIYYNEAKAMAEWTDDGTIFEWVYTDGPEKGKYYAWCDKYVSQINHYLTWYDWGEFWERYL